MKRSRPIRTPLRQHFRRFRYQLLPVLVFCACVLAVGWLREGRLPAGAVVGEVASSPMEIITLADGMLVMPQDKVWRKLDKVAPDDWLVRLDSRPAELALGVMKSKLAELRADLKAVEARLLNEQMVLMDQRTQEARRLAVDLETLSLNVLDRQTRIEADRIQLQRREERLEALKKLVAEGAASQYALDDAKLVYETLKEEIKQQAKALDGAKAIRDKAQARMDARTQEAQRLAVNFETLSLDVQARQTRIEVDRIQLQQHEERLEALKKLVKDGAESQDVLDDATRRYETLKEDITQRAKALDGAIAIRDKAQARMRAYNASTTDRELVVHLDPIRANIATQKLRVAELEDVIKRLVIRAHTAGQIVEIYRHPGQNIRAREPVMIIEPEGSDYIISYVPEGQFIEPVIGMTVEIRARTRPQIALAKVDQVGLRVEAVPMHQLSNPRVPQWGVPVRIGIPKKMTLKPGELVDVIFKPD